MQRFSNGIPIYFVIGILLTCLFYTTIVLDYTLVPRFLFLSLFLLSFLLLVIFESRKEVHYKIGLILSPISLFVVFTLMSVFWSVNKSLAIIESSKTVLYLIVLLITVQLFKFYRDNFLTMIVKVVIVLFFISLVKLLVQFLEMPGFLRINLYGLTGISGHKNLYSSFLFLCTVFSAIGIFRLKGFWKIISIGAVLSQLVIIGFLQTRAVWIGYIIFISCALFLLYLRKSLKFNSIKRVIVIIISIVIFFNIFFIVILPNLIHIYIDHQPKGGNTENISDLTTFSERVLIWDKTYQIIFDHPVMGVGANNWQIHFPSHTLPNVYRITDLNVTFQRPHNDLLWVFSEYGLVGLNLCAIFIVTILTLLFFSFVNKYDLTCLCVIAGIIGFLSISFYDFPKERIEHNLLYFILLGTGYYFGTKGRIIKDTKFFVITRAGIIVLLVSVLIVTYFGLLSFKGEYYTKKMHIERDKKKYANIVSLTSKAESLCYALDPTSVPLSWYRGNANVRLGNYAGALHDFKTAYLSHPFNYTVLNDLASSYVLNSEISLAKKFYMKSAEINPRFDDPKLNLTAIYINEGNYKEALKWNESVLHESERRNYYRSLIVAHPR